MTSTRLPTRGILFVNGAGGALGQAVAHSAGIQTVRLGMRRSHGGSQQHVQVDSDGTVAPQDLEGVTVIINCAGLVFGSDQDVTQANLVHPVRFAKAAKELGVRRFVQVSSFSVFGDAEKIGRSTSSNAMTRYGRTKLAAEHALQNLSSADFDVAVVRLPLIFGLNKPGLMGKLIRILHRVPLFPVARKPCPRSAITYEDAGDMLVAIARTDESGAMFAADPQTFDVATVMARMSAAGHRTARLVELPDFLIHATNKFAPPIGRRLFRGSMLEPADNWLRDRQLKIGIWSEIDKLIGAL